MQNKEDLIEQFSNNVERISAKFVDIFDLKYEKDEDHLDSARLRWGDFVLRYIPNQSRQVVLSNKFPKTLSAELQTTFDNFVSKIKAGNDLNPYQSKGLILFNDTSGRKRQSRTDLLWADWGIHHLHLTNEAIDPGKYFSPRSEWLVFCFVYSNAICIIDIRHHNEAGLFEDDELIRTAIDSWPTEMDSYKLNGVIGGGVTQTPSTIKKFRKSGITNSIEHNGSVYIGPGLGVTSASTSTKVSMMEITISQCIHKIAEVVLDDNEQFKSHFEEGIDLNYSLEVIANGLSVYESNSDTHFVLPETFLPEIHQLLAPKWACEKIT